MLLLVQMLLKTIRNIDVSLGFTKCQVRLWSRNISFQNYVTISIVSKFLPKIMTFLQKILNIVFYHYLKMSYFKLKEKGNRCECIPGFYDSDETGQLICLDNDECADVKCGENTVCQNTVGSYACACKPGYHDIGGKCIDKDECAMTTSTCDLTKTICKNTIGEFKMEKKFLRNFGPKSKFWSKIEILVENRNFGPKSKFWPKIEILVQNRNFGRKSKFWSKIEILVEN